MQKTSPPKLFDMKRLNAIEVRAKNIHREDSDFLYREAALTIADRLGATNRKFDVAVNIIGQFTSPTKIFETCEKIETTKQIKIRQNEENTVLDLEQNSTNLITSVFNLHRVNDLPGMLIQIKNSLVPDGLFMACLPGDQTLMELRTCLIEAESLLTGTASLRVDPFVEVRQAGALLQRAGFALPVVDTDILTIRYSNVRDLINDLRAMGANNAFADRSQFGPRNLLEKTEEIYLEKFADPDGRIRASVEIIYLSGWRPHSSQQQPLKPGSAIKNLKDVLE